MSHISVTQIKKRSEAYEKIHLDFFSTIFEFFNFCNVNEYAKQKYSNDLESELTVERIQFHMHFYDE